MTHGPAGAATLRTLVIGDLMVDVIAVMSRGLARGSDTPSRITTQGGGSAANVAAWLALQQVQVGAGPEEVEWQVVG